MPPCKSVVADFMQTGQAAAPTGSEAAIPPVGAPSGDAAALFGQAAVNIPET